MPELPEVETIRRDLEKILRGDAVCALEVGDRRLLSETEEARWRRGVFGHAWTHFDRHGKYLSIALENGRRILFHLRMSGQLILNGAPPAPKARLRLNFVSGRTLAFCDQRRFGEVWLLEPGESWRSSKVLGPDALNELSREAFVKIVRARSARIQPILMDQRLMAGVGNIYAQEALFRARLRPSRPGRRVKIAEAERLYDALRQTLETAIERRGSTSRNYRDAYGQAGAAQSLHAVYRKGGKPCPRCAQALRAVRIGGRGSVYCPGCQT